METIVTNTMTLCGETTCRLLIVLSTHFVVQKIAFDIFSRHEVEREKSRQSHDQISRFYTFRSCHIILHDVSTMQQHSVPLTVM